MDEIFALFMRLNGGNWAAVAMGVIYVSTIIMTVATVNLVFRLCDKNQLIFSPLLALLLCVNGNYLAMHDTFPISVSSISLGPAYVCAILAISFVIGENKKFNVAYFALCASALLHIHEGVYGFVIVFIFQILEVVHKKQVLMKETRGIILYLGTVVSIVLPNMLTDKLTISDCEFVYEASGMIVGNLPASCYKSGY